MINLQRKNFLKNEKFLFLFSILLILNYGLTPYIFTDVLQIQNNFPFSKTNMIYSCVLIIFFSSFFYLHKFIKSTNLLQITKYQITKSNLLIIFIISSISFYITPWSLDRDSIYASINGFLKMFWFIIILNNSNRKDLQKYFIFFTVVLMILEQSRTYFLLSLFVLLLNTKKKKTLFIFSFLMISIVAVLRNEFDDISLLTILTYGLKGEAMNGAYGINQVLSINSSFNILQLISTFTQFLVTPINWIFRIFSINNIFFDSSLINSKLIDNQLNEIYNPMAGFYLLSEFIQYGVYGIILMCIYLFQVYFITKKLFDTNIIPTGAILLFIAIKSTPFIYWKMVYALLFVQLFYLVLFKNIIKNAPGNYKMG